MKLKEKELQNDLFRLFGTVQFATIEDLEYFQNKMADHFQIDSYYYIFFDHLIGAIKNVRKEMMK